jgi:hypothetical protein
MNQHLNQSVQHTPEEIEEWVSQLFVSSDTGNQLKEEHLKQFNLLYENIWLGLPWYLQHYANDWVHYEDVIMGINEGISRTNSLEEGTNQVLNLLKKWTEQVTADFIGALCLLEAEAAKAGSTLEIIGKVSETEGSYAGYIKLREQDLELSEPIEDLKPGMGYYIAQPIIQNEPGFLVWVSAVVDVALDQKRKDIKEALSAMSFSKGSFDEFIYKLVITLSNSIQDIALLCGYIAHLFNLQRFYLIK